MFRSDLAQSLIYMEFAMLAKKCISIAGFDFTVALLLQHPNFRGKRQVIELFQTRPLLFTEFAMLAKKCIFVTEFVLWGPNPPFYEVHTNINGSKSDSIMCKSNRELKMRSSIIRENT
jgi:hypothetical protein